MGPCCPDLIESGGDVGGAGDVCLQEQGAAAERFDRGGDFLGARALAAIVDGDVGTELGELAGDAGSDASRGSGDEGRLAEK